MSWLGGAQRGFTVLVVCAMSRDAKCDEHEVGFVIYLLHRVRVYTPRGPHISHTMAFPNEPVPRTSQIPYCFFCSLTAVAPSPIGR